MSAVAHRYLGILYGSMEPSEIEDALGMRTTSTAAPVDMDLDEVVG